MAVPMSGAVRCKGPLADGARVYMDELTFGVIAYATGSEGERSVAQLRRWNARNPDIERIALNMLRVLGCVGGSSLAERIVGLLGSVAAKDLDGAAGSIQLPEHRVEDVEGAWIIAFDFVVVTVTKEIAERVKRVENVRIAYPVDDVEDLATLAHQLELVLLAVIRHVLIRDRTQGGHGNVRQHASHSVWTPVGRNVAGAGRRSESHEYTKRKECANLSC